jgi:hypothetical protein
MRNVDLAVLKEDIVKPWLRSALKGFYVISENKPSSSAELTFLLSTKLVLKALRLYVEVLRPFFKLMCTYPKRKAVHENDVRHFDSLIRIPEDQWFMKLQLAGLADGKNENAYRAPLIFAKFPPTGGWNTKKLNHPILVAAHRRPALNNSLLLDHNGKAMVDMGKFVKTAFEEYTGLAIGSLQLRRIVQTEAGQASSRYAMISKALDHGVKVAKKHYSYTEVKQLALEWTKYYDLGLDEEEEGGKLETLEDVDAEQPQLDLDLLVRTAENPAFRSASGSQVSWKRVATVSGLREHESVLRDTYRRHVRKRQRSESLK